MTETAVDLDVWADIACPWCFLGSRQLAAVITQSEPGSVRRRHRSFQLAPDMPARGMPRAEHVRRILGGDEVVAAAHSRLQALADPTGIRYAFEAMPVSANSALAHRAVLAFDGDARQDAVLDALYRAYWEDGRDITDVDVVTALAVHAAGGAESEVREAIHGAAVTDRLTTDQAEARSLGVTGVPTVIANGRVAVSGAQPPEVLRRLLAQARRG